MGKPLVINRLIVGIKLKVAACKGARAGALQGRRSRTKRSVQGDIVSSFRVSSDQTQSNHCASPFYRAGVWARGRRKHHSGGRFAVLGLRGRERRETKSGLRSGMAVAQRDEGEMIHQEQPNPGPGGGGTKTGRGAGGRTCSWEGPRGCQADHPLFRLFVLGWCFVRAAPTDFFLTAWRGALEDRGGHVGLGLGELCGCL